jgi:Protein of unknown function (DUF541)
MRGKLWAILVAGGATVALAAAPVAAAAGQTVTATGTGLKAVHPSNRNNNASIVRAFDAARHAAIGGALRQAHEYAVDYAKAVGLTLGPVMSVSDAQNTFYGPGSFYGPFGPDQFCGTLRQPIFKKGKNGKRKVVGSHKVHRCIVPSFANVTLTVTYAAT